MHSLSDLIDKLIIENIKIFNKREQLSQISENSPEYVKIYETMMILNENRSLLCNAVDEKFDNVISGKEKNTFLKKIRTYND